MDDKNEWIHVGNKDGYLYEITNVSLFTLNSSFVFELSCGLEKICTLKLFYGNGVTNAKIKIFEDDVNNPLVMYNGLLWCFADNYWSNNYNILKKLTKDMSCEKDMLCDKIFENFKQDIIGSLLVSSKLCSNDILPYYIEIILKKKSGDNFNVRKLMIVPTFSPSTCICCRQDTTIGALFKVKKGMKTVSKFADLNYEDLVKFTNQQQSIDPQNLCFY